MKDDTTDCPCCNGTGETWLFPFCMWCRSSGKITREKAMQFADHKEMLAHGGYICGDHSFEDMNRLLGEAKAIRNKLTEIANA